MYLVFSVFTSRSTSLLALHRNKIDCGGLVSQLENWTWRGDLHVERNRSGVSQMALPASLPELII
jgi:hypothetical protein